MKREEEHAVSPKNERMELPRRIGSRLALIASVVALVASIGSLTGVLGMAFLLTPAEGPQGPPGPMGPAGPPGPQGPGSLAVSSSYDSQVTIPEECTAYGSTPAITVPSSGIIVVTATVEAKIGHLSGQADSMFIYLGEDPTDCSLDPNDRVWYVGPTQPTGAYYEYFMLAQPFNVTSAGSYTYYLNGLTTNSATSDGFNRATLVAVFYPS